MKKIAALLLSLLLICGMGMTVYGEEVTIKTVVPAYHIVTVEASGGRVIADDQLCSGVIQIPRQKEQTWWLVPDQGKTLSALYYNGENVTGQMNGCTFTAPPLTDDAVLKAVFVDSPSQEEHYDVEVTVIDENGEPVPGVTVDIGGYTGVTDGDGKSLIADVPPVECPVVITDEEGIVIGIGEITIGGSGSGDFTVTTDENGNPVIIPGEDTQKICLTLVVEKDGGLTVKDIKPVTGGEGGNTPQTGDSSHPWLWLILMLVSSGGLAAATLCGKRKQNRFY